jgi:hypothetical protein
MNSTPRILMACIAAVMAAAGLAQAASPPASSLGSEPPGIKCFDAATRQPIACTPAPPPAVEPSTPAATAAKERLQMDGGPAAGALVTPPPPPGPTRFDATGAPVPAPAPQKSRENK